jgi:O-antigen/teichoic acid export membrane protein
MFPAGYSTTVKFMIVILGLAVCFNALNQSVYNYFQAVQQMVLAAGFQFLNTVLIGVLTMLVILGGLGVVAITFTHLLSYIIISVLIYLALRGKIKPQIETNSLPAMVKKGLPFGIHRISIISFSS